MIKTLQEIQQENRRLIICAAHKTDDINIALDRASYCPKVNIYGLNWVLLVCASKKEFNDTLSIDQKILTFQLCFDGWWEYVKWDLTKETLESQSEETQISINKLLTE